MHSAYSISNFEERADGFYKAIRANGMSTSKCIVHHLTPSQEGACADIRALIESGEELAPCYFADNDYIAVGAITALKEAGYRIPEDVSIIGMDDTPVCLACTPQLSTIHVYKKEMGFYVVQTLRSLKDSSTPYAIKAEIGVSVVLRDSICRRAPSAH